MGKSQIHLHLLVSCSGGRQVIIYRASDNWQQFCRAPLIFVFCDLIATQYASAKCSRAFVNYSACHGAEKISCHSRWENEAKENKIFWNLMAFGSFCGDWFTVFVLSASFLFQLIGLWQKFDFKCRVLLYQAGNKAFQVLVKWQIFCPSVVAISDSQKEL